MKYTRAIAAGAALLLSLCRPALSGASPVILSLDVEEPGDDQALRRLDLKIPATYFITGQFATDHPEAVAALSNNDNTIGSHSFNHPHFNSLSPEAVRNEVTSSKNLLESITGKKVTWFRAPYLEYDDRLMQSLRDAGYKGDSSDKDSWANQATVLELPISNFEDSSLIASDYDMLEEEHYTGRQFRDALMKMYREKDKSGAPLVVLLHPSISSREAGALHEFIDMVRRSGGEFFSIDGYLAGFREHHPVRKAVWIDPSDSGPAPEMLARDLSARRVTEVFLKATDKEGNRYYGGRTGTDRYGKLVAALKFRGLKVHAWISTLADRKALEKHPEWGMIAKDGTRSDRWMSPGNPEVTAYLSRTIRTLAATYRIDGICMDNLAYPDAEFDYTPAIVEAYAKHENIGHLPKLEELMNDDYTSWCAWRSTVIANLAGRLRNTAKHVGKGPIECSAIIPGNTAGNYRIPETSGQNVGLLCQHIDLVVADIPLGSKDANLYSLPLNAFAMHIRAGGKPVLYRLNDTASPQPVSDEVRAEAAGKLATGSDGVSLLPHDTSTGRQRLGKVFPDR